MGHTGYNEAFEQFHQLTAENVGLNSPTMFGEERVREICVVDSIMCCAATRYRATPDGVIRTHLDPRTLEATESRTFFEPGDEAATVLQRVVQKLQDDHYRKRPLRSGHHH